MAATVAMVIPWAGCGKPAAQPAAKPVGEPAAAPAGQAAKPAAAGSPRIAVVLKASESEFWQIVKHGAETAGRELGATVTVQSPVSESQVEKQISVVENAVSAKPDAIVLAPTQSSPLVPAIEAAMAQGLPVVTIDSKADTEKVASFLASDNRRIGTIAADAMAKALTAKTGAPAGKVAAITFFSGAASLEMRKQGFEERLREKYPQIQIVDFRDAGGQTGKSIAFVENFLTAYPDLKGIFANNQPTGEETVRALDDAKRKNLAVVVVDAGEQEVWGLRNGYVDAMIVQMPWKMGYMGVEYAIKAAKGEKLPPFVDTGIAAISPEMIRSGAAEEYLNPVAFHSKPAAK